MSLGVVGTMAPDTVKTPFGEVKEVLGGAATYFAPAASRITELRDRDQARPPDRRHAAGRRGAAERAGGTPVRRYVQPGRGRAARARPPAHGACGEERRERWDRDLAVGEVGRAGG